MSVPRTEAASPSETLRESLATSRTEGLPWTEAWDKAVREALQDVSGGQRRSPASHADQWAETIAWSEPYFRYAYTRRGPDPCGRFAIYGLV